MLSRIVSGVAGVAIIAAVVHYSVIANGGYNWATSPLFGALAVGLVAGAIACGRSDRRPLALGIVVAMLAGEGFQLIQTAERTTGIADARQAPLREAATAREKAADLVREAEAALSRLHDTPRFLSAIAAKSAADEAVRGDASKPGCARNCRALLEQQVSEAQKEIEAARAELEKSRETARQNLAGARAALTALPAMASATPLADRIGIEQWKIDLASAGLLSFGANGLGAFLVAFAFRPRRREGIEIVEAAPVELMLAASEPSRIDVGSRKPAKEANRFAGAVLTRSDVGSVRLVDIRRAYREWCASYGMVPLTDAEIGAALSQLFARVGIYPEGEGQEATITGIEWRPQAMKQDR